MNMPFLSICIPTYNRPEYLRACLLSLASGISDNNREKIEVVITDNSDNNLTENMVSEFRKTFPPIRYMRNETNIGGPNNLFRVLEKASGKYLWLMGDDDIVVSGKITLILEKLSQADYSAAILNFAQGDGRNPEMIMLDNCLDLKEDKIFSGRRELFVGKEFVNFFALNFMSALIFNREDFESIKEKAAQFINTCYPQSYAFLLIAALDKPILRLSEVCVLWRSPEITRRYDTWQKDESDIFNQYIGYVRYAREIGFEYDSAYLEESIRFKAINLLYFKKSQWKNDVKNFLVKLKIDKLAMKAMRFFRYLKYVLKSY
jgi:glycosyltransferase involved in cell wall biosynthesis